MLKEPIPKILNPVFQSYTGILGRRYFRGQLIKNNLAFDWG